MSLPQIKVIKIRKSATNLDPIESTSPVISFGNESVALSQEETELLQNGLIYETLK